MGTMASIVVRAPAPVIEPGPVPGLGDAVDWLHLVDDTFSTYQPESAISRLNRAEITLADCPPDVAAVLELCAVIEAETEGYFTARWNGTIDPTGLVKGWSVERASHLLGRAGSPLHAICAGGDVRTGGAGPPRPWHVGVADPFHPRRCITAVHGRQLAVATSGVHERGLHIVDPFSGRAGESWASVTVVGPDLTRADAYATAAVAMGRGGIDWLAARPGWEGIAVDGDGAVVRTPGFDDHDGAAASAAQA